MMTHTMLRFVTLAVAMWGTAAWADPKDCEELKGEIAAKLDAKGVQHYTLTVVTNDLVGEQKVVGSCAGGSKKIVYQRQ